MSSLKVRTEQWKKFYDSASPETMAMPHPFSKAEDLLWLSVLRCVRPDKLVSATQVSFSIYLYILLLGGQV